MLFTDYQTYACSSGSSQGLQPQAPSFLSQCVQFLSLDICHVKLHLNMPHPFSVSQLCLCCFWHPESIPIHFLLSIPLLCCLISYAASFPDFSQPECTFPFYCAASSYYYLTCLMTYDFWGLMSLDYYQLLSIHGGWRSLRFYPPAQVRCIRQEGSYPPPRIQQCLALRLGYSSCSVNAKGVELPPCPHLIILILQGGGLRV